MQLSYDAEEYVETIYRLQKYSGVAKTKELAEALHVVPGSITNTIEHLETHGLVMHEPYRGVKLTVKGEKLALDILRRHRLAERLLTDILNAEWSSVHENACKLEHALTKDVIELLEKKLGNPKVCPHGNPIPTENGKLEEEECYPLAEMSLNILCKVTQITDEKQEKLQELARKRIKPNTLIYVIRKKPSSIFVRIEGRECILGMDDAATVWVKLVKAETNAV